MTRLEGKETSPDITAILGDLIAFESVSHRSNLDIVDYIGALLRKAGVPYRLIPNAAGDKASILATIGPVERPGIVLSAHTDVVPVEGQDWSSPPFAATLRDGRLYGRGSSDMKGFVASVLAYVPVFAASARAMPVHLALSYDEEIGCAGAPDLVAAVAALPMRPSLCIVGEPTGMRVAYAHKGKLARRVTVLGRGGHSALPHRAANAVEAAAAIACDLAALGAELRVVSNEAFDPPWSSVHVGSLHGGGALNLVPDRAVLEFEVRTLPGTDAADVIARIDAILQRARRRIREQAAEADVRVEEISAYPSLDTPADSAAVGAARELAASDAPPLTLAFGTEAGLYAEAGIPTVVCGPGDISRAHKADEWIGLDELAAAGRMMQRLADRASQVPQ
ncbi:acetylornithine deacetylase [Starkeya sp. ORNL1]|uniref:acetylornithine deacetylase n=1 Tax=Starkeya sp. ORNL1 TaxID=2709380 RepID=UPI0014628A0B|nr:acetylornithine deacetylase [Starkeya sp. ORNL1]QJP13358.1 acetylornithine deacetylase [Starkeya sp. ORNL1]